mmetsp:Transcript_87255/g.251655  ORF Transcript_87255/g.251655 Transcript_87255/m.251655 type:complete len:295 (-) Transcript_87255:180-1064(-)
MSAPPGRSAMCGQPGRVKSTHKLASASLSICRRRAIEAWSSGSTSRRQRGVKGALFKAARQNIGWSWMSTRRLSKMHFATTCPSSRKRSKINCASWSSALASHSGSWGAGKSMPPGTPSRNKRGSEFLKTSATCAKNSNVGPEPVPTSPTYSTSKIVLPPPYKFITFTALSMMRCLEMRTFWRGMLATTTSASSLLCASWLGACWANARCCTWCNALDRPKLQLWCSILRTLLGKRKRQLPAMRVHHAGREPVQTARGSESCRSNAAVRAPQWKASGSGTAASASPPRKCSQML